MNTSHTDSVRQRRAGTPDRTYGSASSTTEAGMIVVRRHEVLSRRRGHLGAPASPSADYRGEATVHVIGFWQYVIGDVLQLAVPRAVCGERLAGDPDQADPAHLGAPMCAACSRRIGGRARRQVPAHVMRAPAPAGSAL